MTTSQMRSRRAYALATLAQADLCASRRSAVEAGLARIDAKLGARCGRCGRHLEAVESVASGIGPVCAHKAA